MALVHSVIGEGATTVVLLHGFLGMGRNLRTLATKWVAADATKRIVLVDLPGHGESPPPAEDETLQSMAAKVREVIPPGPAHWVGHSLGGRVALAASDVDAANVLSMSMLDISPSPIPSNDSESGSVLQVLRRAPATAANRDEYRQFFKREGLSTHLTEWLLTNVMTDGERVRWRFDREALQRLHQRVNAQDLWPLVERRAAKVHCVRGNRSKYVSDEDAQRLSANGAKVTEVESGHYVHVEALEPLVTELVDWTR